MPIKRQIATNIDKNKKVALVFASIDGVIGSHSGMGTITQHFIKILPSIAKKYHAKGVKLDFYVMTQSIAKKYHGYSRLMHKNTETICHSLGGQLHLMDQTNNSQPLNFRAGWAEVSKNTASIVVNLAEQYNQTIVYVVGLPFLKLPCFVNEIDKDLSKKVKIVLLSYSDFFLFKNIEHNEHIRWEDESFKQINLYENTYMAATSKYQIELLKQWYKLPADKIIPLQTGLYMDDEMFAPIARHRIMTILKSKNIPTDVDIIFSVGRAAPPKGFGELLLVFSELLKIHKKPVHLVFIASNYQVFSSASVVSRLKQIITDQNLQNYVTPIYHYDLDLPKNMFQWENTKIVAQLALQESFGLVPEEARISPNSAGPVVVASNLGGFKEQITNGKDGFLVDPKDHVQTAKIMSKILNMSEPELAKIRKAGLARVKRDYDYTKNVIESLERLVE